MPHDSVDLWSTRLMSCHVIRPFPQQLLRHVSYALLGCSMGIFRNRFWLLAGLRERNMVQCTETLQTLSLSCHWTAILHMQCLHFDFAQARNVVLSTTEASSQRDNSEDDHKDRQSIYRTSDCLRDRPDPLIPFFYRLLDQFHKRQQETHSPLMHIPSSQGNLQTFYSCMVWITIHLSCSTHHLRSPPSQSVNLTGPDQAPRATLVALDHFPLDPLLPLRCVVHYCVVRFDLLWSRAR